MKRKYILAIGAGVLAFAAAVAIAREYVASHVFRPTANDRELRQNQVLFRQETEKYQAFADRLQQTGSEEELNSILKEEYQRVGMELPYQRSFDSFMRDPDTVLVFG